MNTRVAYYLHTDPFYERFEAQLRLRGFSMSPVSMDEFEATAQSGQYKVYRDVKTGLDTRFQLALDKDHHTGLVSCNVPAGYDPPLTSEQCQLQDLMRHGPGSK